MPSHPSLARIIALALTAGREILAIRDRGFDTQHKADGSPVTQADEHAEALIEAGLREIAPDIPMIGEEAVAQGRTPRTQDRFFCVDALDGTRGFAKGGDEFTVNIALVEDGAPLMGVVFAPATGELYAGQPGRAVAGRYDGRSGQALNMLCPIRVNDDPPPQWRIVASHYSGRNQATGAFIAALNGAAAHASSSIKFCRLAEGAAELYPRFGEVHEWDAAAGHAILRAAGGDIMELGGAPLRYRGSGGDLRLRGFIAHAGEKARAAALQALTQISVQ
jgi:3'(2'),5'-bisphosphate nucleotidase